MKVILNVDAITHPLTGIGQYTLHLGKQLPLQNGLEAVKYFSSDHWIDDINQSAQANQWISRLRPWIPFKGLALNAYAKRRNKHFKQLTGDLSDHVFHSPNFVLMPFAGKSVATFHDLSFVHYRETQPNYRLQFLDREIPKTLNQADVLMVPTEFIKQEIMSHYAYPAAKIHVTPLGVEAGFKAYSANETRASLQAHQLKHKQFILSVATTEPRKNLSRLLQAYTQLPKALRAAYPLVLVGSKGWLNQDINQRIKSLVKKGQIISLGYVDQTALQHLYAAAQVMAFPSLYEGFGLPIIESMASGTAVLTSHHSAMQEVAGGHAMLCDPLDVQGIKAGLRAALENETWLTQAQANGLAHSKQFTWQRCAEKTVMAYES
ncbi:glycosyltransferase family 4 protein [Marinicella litoralis]|uniref:Alpha-1,3-rhamnosyl/mannosyltransferase n=1 Tax=Marinicella litoralis TaxID=644220 RepID=A0A4R6XYX2_9GAMM|nr:glycosyltransferase family 1 protein [Marinicella litoralis]TDR23839.1 alpha-1,3-rhamnosyl/mannosyltransferase [Marinicella litoralis]